MRYILDGYNIIFSGDIASRQCAPDELAGARRQLIRLSAQLRRKTHARILIFFDGGEEGAHQPRRHSEGGVEIVFSRVDSSADDDIIDHLRRTTGTRTLVVVSDDNAVKRAARRARARAMGTAQFLRETSKTLSAGKLTSEPPVKYQGISEHEVGWWKRYFNIDEEEP